MTATFDCDIGTIEFVELLNLMFNAEINLDNSNNQSIPIISKLNDKNEKVGVAKNLRIKNHSVWATLTVRKEYLNCTFGIGYDEGFHVWTFQNSEDAK